MMDGCQNAMNFVLVCLHRHIAEHTPEDLRRDTNFLNIERELCSLLRVGSLLEDPVRGESQCRTYV
jgi:hypothetical protein